MEGVVINRRPLVGRGESSGILQHVLAELRQLRYENSELLRRNSELEEQLAELRQGHQELLAKHAQPLVDHELLQKQHSDLLSRYNDLQQKHDELQKKYDDLQLENAGLRQQNEELKRENLDLRCQAGFWKSQHGKAKEKIGDLGGVVKQLKGEIQKLKARHFGKKGEQKASQDHSNTLDSEKAESDAKPKSPRGQRAGKPGPEKRNHSHLPEREEFHDIPKDQQKCPNCGAPFVANGTEDSEQVEIEVKAYRRKIRRKRYQSTCQCADCQRTVTAPLPPKLIPKGSIGTTVWIELILGKYYSHMPISRQLNGFRLLDLDLAPGTVIGGLKRLESLFHPIYEALLARNPQSTVCQADETRWMVFIDQEGKVGHRWWMWAFLGVDTIVFRLDPSRSHNVPESHYTKDGELVMVVDRFSAYKAMVQVKNGTIKLAFCWAHVRRDFIEVGKGWKELDPWACGWLEQIRLLYVAQDQRLGHEVGSPEFQAGDAEVRRIVGEMESQADQELSDPKLREPCRKALQSLKNHWSGLTIFVDDLRIPLDNNRSERAQRGPAVGRKNYYGSGALWSGQLAAMMFSIFATLGLLAINSRQWLTDFLNACAENGGKPPKDITRFLPWNYLAETAKEPTTDIHATESSTEKPVEPSDSS